MFLNERGVVSLGWQKSSSVKVLENMTLFAHRCYTEKKKVKMNVYTCNNKIVSMLTVELNKKY